jgi:hypothetical protein
MLKAFPFGRELQDCVWCILSPPMTNPTTYCVIPAGAVKLHIPYIKNICLKMVVFQKLTFTATNRKPALDERFVIRNSILHGTFLFFFPLVTSHL